MTNNLICPVCGCPLIKHDNTMKCEKNHSFDIAKEGYLNLLMKSYSGLYQGSELFQSRRKVYNAGFFDPIVAECAYLIESRIDNTDSHTILDVGCGEGSFLGKINRLLPESDCIGTDISKNAVRLASKAYKNCTWIVSDLCAMPVADNSMDCILNILAPANYAEFDRILKNGGYVIKAVPNKEYLKEIREIYGIDPLPDKGTDELFAKNFEIIDSSSIKYIFDINEANTFDNDLRYDIMLMTPLTNHKNIESDKRLDQLTVDINILIGRK